VLNFIWNIYFGIVSNNSLRYQVFNRTGLSRSGIMQASSCWLSHWTG